MKQLLALMIAGMYSVSSSACLVYAVGEGADRYVGRSFDWELQDGVALVNPRNAQKYSLVFDKISTPAEWISKYGSVTLNLAGDEFPMSGLNEAGLSVDVLILQSSEFPKKSPTPAMNEVQWIQYILDTSATVEEAKVAASKVRIDPFTALVHYMVCDAQSTCAVFENLDGQLVISQYISGQKHIIANDRFSQTIDPEKMTRRPKIIYNYLKDTPMDVADPVSFVVGGLNKVATRDYTRWQIVYSVNDRQISFRHFDKNRNLKMIDLKSLSFECTAQKNYIDISDGARGEVNSRLLPFKKERNTQLLRQILVDQALLKKVQAYYNQAITCVGAETE